MNSISVRLTDAEFTALTAHCAQGETPYSALNRLARIAISGPSVPAAEVPQPEERAGDDHDLPLFDHVPNRELAEKVDRLTRQVSGIAEGMNAAVAAMQEMATDNERLVRIIEVGGRP